jgi:predicted nucleic acid-binding protein
MILLDTNVLSELMKPPERRTPRVFARMHAFPSDASYTAAVCVAELLAGIEVMQPGRRRDETREIAERVLSVFAEERILPFDSASARLYAVLLAQRRRAGRAPAPLDLQIAAIAGANGMAVMTRNVSDFEHCGVEIIDPWEP